MNSLMPIDADPDRREHARREHAATRLHHWLNYGSKSAILGFGAFWLPIGPVTMLVVVLALLFTPYLLWRLYQIRWYGWLGVFVVVVLVPLLIVRPLVDPRAMLWWYVFTVGPLLTFYLFIWVLRYVLGEHVDELKALRFLEASTRVDGEMGADVIGR